MKSSAHGYGLGRVSKACTAAGAGLLAWKGRQSRAASVAGSALVLAGGLALRWSVFRAGFQSVGQGKLDGGFGKNRIKLILNRAPKRLDITPGELEKMLGVPIFCMVPNDYPELYETYAEGRMLSRGSELGKHMAKLASKLANLEEDRPANGNGKKRFALFG